jgi:hypothetical protein
MRMDIPESGKCHLCDGTYTRYGNNPQPVLDSVYERVCSRCQADYVMPVRMGAMTAAQARTSAIAPKEGNP